ncbi:MAG: carboxypeptidase-like regulatory domain-containing protein, partial [Phaeodactylibacter sp.]|nr:carboxypeptidase-like regulatory domain-containing protein [Phaeodactylibacter sp.]
MKIEKHLSIFVALLFCTLSLNAQSTIRVSGTVLEAQSQQPLEFATVMIGDRDSKAVLTGTTTDLDGKFSVEVQAQNIYLEVSFIGFITQTVDA